jgi:uncharacterized protein
MNNQRVIQNIKRTILQVFPDSRIILFGSRARDDYETDSDYDILIIIKDEIGQELKLPYRTQIRKALLEQEIFSDILIQSQKEVEVKKNLTGHIIKTALLEGVTLK